MIRRPALTAVIYALAFSFAVPTLGQDDAASPAPAAPRFKVRKVGGAMSAELFPLAMNHSASLTGYVGEHPHDAFIALRPGGLEIVTSELFTGLDGTAISDTGIIAGVGYKARRFTADYAPFRYSPETGFTLLRPLENSYGVVVAVNDNGDVAGHWDNPSSQWSFYRAFRYSDARGFEPLPLFGGVGSTAAGINNGGQVIGAASARAFLYDDQGGRLLGSLGGQYSSAADINDAGVVVGQAQDEEGVSRAYWYTDQAGMVEIPMPAWAAQSHAAFVNERSQIVGVVSDSDGVESLFTYNAGAQQARIIPLPPGQRFVTVAGFNDRGELVGSSNDGQYGGIAMTLYHSAPTGIVDLESLLSDAAPIHAIGVSGITNSGIIAGRIQYQDFTQAAVRLIPVNTPVAADEADAP